MFRLYIIAGAVAAGVVALGGVYLKGRHDGYESGRVAQLEASVKAYQDRQEIEDEVSGTDRVAVCVELGGLPERCEQLRGVEEASETE